MASESFTIEYPSFIFFAPRKRHEVSKVIHKVIPTFGKLTAKSRDKLVNHSCQLVYS